MDFTTCGCRRALEGLNPGGRVPFALKKYDCAGRKVPVRSTGLPRACQRVGFTTRDGGGAIPRVHSAPALPPAAQPTALPEASHGPCVPVPAALPPRRPLASRSGTKRFGTHLRPELLLARSQPSPRLVGGMLTLAPTLRPSAPCDVSPVWDLIPLCSGKPRGQSRMNRTWSKVILHKIGMEACSWENRVKSSNDHKTPISSENIIHGDHSQEFISRAN